MLRLRRYLSRSSCKMYTSVPPSFSCFGCRFDLFSRRAIKLIDLFSTIQQFKKLREVGDNSPLAFACDISATFASSGSCFPSSRCFQGSMAKTCSNFCVLPSFYLQARIEGMEPLLDGFKTAVMVFRVKGHNLLDYHSNRFDRDFVTFNVRRAIVRSGGGLIMR